MQEVQTTSRKKLALKKQVVSNLSADEMDNVNAGEAAVTTSYNSCTGFTCCHSHTTETVTISIIISIIILL